MPNLSRGQDQGGKFYESKLCRLPGAAVVEQTTIKKSQDVSLKRRVGGGLE